MSLILATLPMLLLVLAGYTLRVTGTIPPAQWAGIDTLAFRLLIPAMLVHSIAEANLAEVAAGPFVPALLMVLALMGAAAFALRAFWPGLSDPSFTTLFQIGTRWNAFIALTAAQQFAGPEALTWLAVAMAVTIVVINLANIAVLGIWGRPPEGAPRGPAGMLRVVLTNPLVQASVIGLVLNLTGLGLPDFLAVTLDLAGRAALSVGLLCVGAGLMPRRLFSASAPMWAGLALRPVLAPSLFLAIGWGFGLAPAAMLAGALVFLVPAAANGYIVARQMGGDAELYAAILTWQTLLCLPLLPLLAALVL
ncbi:MAG: AEC family transporter [Proteobacteria bacterium]|nr:AEC family transporter [Pseudomonadota bacterium]